jgi:hypothetical protein
VESLRPHMHRRGPHPRTMSGKATYPRRRYTRRGCLRVAVKGVAAACGSVLTACGDARLVRKLRVSPDPARVDEPFAITLKNLSPWQHVTLRDSSTPSTWSGRRGLRFGPTSWGRMYPGNPR